MAIETGMPERILSIMSEDELLIYEYLVQMNYYDPEREAISATIIGKEHNRFAPGIKSLDRHEAWALPICKKLEEKGLVVCIDGNKFKVETPIGLEATLNSKEQADYYNVRIRPHLNLIKTMRKKGKGHDFIAKAIGISPTIFWKYAQQYPALHDLLKESMSSAVSEIEISMHERATGYYYDEVRVKTTELKTGEIIKETTTTKKHVPADPQLIKFYLMNRNREDWRHTDHLGGTNIGKLSITNLITEVSQNEEKKTEKPLDPNKAISMEEITKSRKLKPVQIEN